MRLPSLLVAVTSLVSVANGKRLKERIYYDVEATNFCFLRTNGTHQFGCTSELNGNVGVVHLIEGESDVDWLVKEAPHAPYVAVFFPDTFNAKSLVRLRESKKVSGAVLLNVPYYYDGLPPRYSDDSQCPNEISSLYAETNNSCSASEKPWNEGGSGNLLESFPFPIFASSSNETATYIIQECFNKFNKPNGTSQDWPLCALELKSHMYSAVDTETCLRRSNILNIVNPTKFCDEMGDYNTFLFLAERNSTVVSARQDESVIVVSTRMDTLTLFDGTEMGGDSPVTGIVTLLETARLLAENKPDFGGRASNVLFAFFHGEAFDYIGSSRFVYDLQEKKFPDPVDAEKWKGGQQPLLSLTQFHLVLELGQLFNKMSNGSLFVHTDKSSGSSSSLVSSLLSSAKANSVLASEASGNALPPSSLHSFLKADRTLSSIFVSDYDKSYSNAYYHSIYDTGAGNLGYSYALGTNQTIVSHISRVAVALAEFIYKETDSAPRGGVGNFASNLTLVNELLHCYLDTANCSLFLAASDERVLHFLTPNKTLSMYVGVDHSPQPHGTLTRNVLAYLTGESLENHTDPKDCYAPKDQNVYEYVFVKGEVVPAWWSGETPCNESAECGYCYRTLSFRRAAVSPAFVIDDYDFSSSKYAAWAESVWKSNNARIFLRASPSLQKAHFTIGVIVLVLSFVLVFWIDRYSAYIFVGSPVESVSGGRESTSTAATETRVGEATAL